MPSIDHNSLRSRGKYPHAVIDAMLERAGVTLGELPTNAYYGDKGKTAYDHSQVAHAPSNAEANVNADWNSGSGDSQILNKPTLGTAAAKNIPATGNASATEVVYGSDTRLADARNAADVSSWAKAGTKPTYNATEVGAEASGAVSTHAALATGVHGAGANSLVYSNDTRLTDARTPTSHGNTAHSETYITQSAITTHEGAADPHTGYQKESEKGSISGYAGLDAASKVPTANLGGAGASGTTFLRGDQTWATPAGGSTPPWHGAIYGASGDGDPSRVLRGLLGAPVHATPTNIAITVARCSYFRPPANITVAKIRWFGVGAVTGLYHVAVYRVSDGARMAILDDFNTGAQAWGSGAFACTLAAGVLYLLAVSVDTVGTTAGVACFSGTTGRIGIIPELWPGNLDVDIASPIIAPVAFVQFAVTAGALPATLPARVLQAAWTGGMPAFFLDANNA